MVLTGSLAVDLGGGKRNCISGVAGIINGCGILGAVLQGGLVAFTYYIAGQTGTAGTGTLYLYPNSTNQFVDAEVVVSNLATLIRISGSSNQKPVMV